MSGTRSRSYGRVVRPRRSRLSAIVSTVHPGLGQARQRISPADIALAAASIRAREVWHPGDLPGDFARKGALRQRTGARVIWWNRRAFVSSARGAALRRIRARARDGGTHRWLAKPV